MSSAVVAPDVASFIASVRLHKLGIQIQTERLERYAVDHLRPSALVEPATIAELQAMLAEAHKHGVAVIPWGGGAHMAAGNTPSSYDVALSLVRMDRIVAHEPADLTVTVEAGVRLATLQAELARHGQFLPLDPPCGAAATIGGVLASNAHGPLRHALGTARDWLIGLRIVQADGTTSKSGGRVVKNVAGYDMHKLHIGALGTLGVIAEATFKVAPLPAVRRTIAIACDAPGPACAIALAACDAGLALHAVELLSPSTAAAASIGSKWTLLVEAAGGAGAVERSLRDLRALASEANATISEQDDHDAWTRWSEAFRAQELALRVAVMPSQVAGAIVAVEGAATAYAQARISATVTAGVIRALVRPEDDGRAIGFIEQVRAALPPGASVVVAAAPPAVKRQIDVFGPSRADFEIMRLLKEQFDPERILSPGRFMGRL